MNSRKRKIEKAFKALSNDTRLQVLSMLSTKTMCVKDIASRLNVSQPAVSQHLGILENAGLVEPRKEGYWVHYSIVHNGISSCVSFLEKFGNGNGNGKK